MVALGLRSNAWCAWTCDYGMSEIRDGSCVNGHEWSGERSGLSIGLSSAACFPFRYLIACSGIKRWVIHPQGSTFFERKWDRMVVVSSM